MSRFEMHRFKFTHLGVELWDTLHREKVGDKLRPSVLKLGLEMIFNSVI